MQTLKVSARFLQPGDVLYKYGAKRKGDVPSDPPVVLRCYQGGDNILSFLVTTRNKGQYVMRHAHNYPIDIHRED